MQPKLKGMKHTLSKLKEISNELKEKKKERPCKRKQGSIKLDLSIKISYQESGKSSIGYILRYIMYYYTFLKDILLEFQLWMTILLRLS